jgi:hypothetical protein
MYDTIRMAWNQRHCACPVLVLLCVTGGNIRIRDSSNSTIAHTLLWPTDKAWAGFFNDVGLSMEVLQQLTVAEAAPVQPLLTLFFFHWLPYGLTTANMTNISTAALPEGVVVNESIPYSDSGGSLLSKSANVITGLPTNQDFGGVRARLGVVHNLVSPTNVLARDYGLTTSFIGPDNANGVNSSVASTAASEVVKDLGPNTANVLFADVAGPNGFVIHVIDQVLRPSNQNLEFIFGPGPYDLVANFTAVAAAGPDCVGGLEGGCDPSFADILLEDNSNALNELNEVNEDSGP